MSACDDDSLERQLPELGGVEDLRDVDPEDAILVDDPTDKFPRTARRDCDVHRAITRGLAAYLLQLEGAVSGRLVSLASVSDGWAEHADGSRPLPSAAVHSEELASIEQDSGMAPGAPIRIDGTDGSPALVLTCSGIYALNELTVDVMCGDKFQRAGVRMMLEDGAWPVEWMSGFRLVLPHYHNAIATFLLLSVAEPDNAELGTAGLRPLMLKFRARCPVYRVHRLPLARIQVAGTIGTG